MSATIEWVRQYKLTINSCILLSPDCYFTLAGHFERPPYSESTLRSVYHLRELEVYRMAHLSHSVHTVDIFLSHDWPAQIWEYGNKERLLKIKPYFREDIQTGKLGNPPLMHLLQSIKPAYWFAAHLHVKFAATVPHFGSSNDMQPPPYQQRGQRSHQQVQRPLRPPPPPHPPLAPPIDTLSGSDAGTLSATESTGYVSGSGYTSGSPRPPPPPPRQSTATHSSGDSHGEHSGSSGLPSLEDATSLSGSSPRPPSSRPPQPVSYFGTGTHSSTEASANDTHSSNTAASLVTQEPGTPLADSATVASSTGSGGFIAVGFSSGATHGSTAADSSDAGGT
jgi:hypothetical protein